MHWKSCCGPCSICGPINVKYNKKKLLKKISFEFVVHKMKQEEEFQGLGETGDWRREGITRAAPYYLRKYMMEDQSPVSAASNGSLPQLVTGKNIARTPLPSAGNTWDQLPGIDPIIVRKPDCINNSGPLMSHKHTGSFPSYSGFNGDSDDKCCMQDLLNAVNLYNYQIQESKKLEEMQLTVMSLKTLWK